MCPHASRLPVHGLGSVGSIPLDLWSSCWEWCPPTPNSALPAGQRSLFTAVWPQCSGHVLHCGLEASPGVALGTVSELCLCCLEQDTPMVAILTGLLKFRKSAGPVGVHSIGTKRRSRMRKSVRRTLVEPVHAARLFRGCSCQVWDREAGLVLATQGHMWLGVPTNCGPMVVAPGDIASRSGCGHAVGFQRQPLGVVHLRRRVSGPVAPPPEVVLLRPPGLPCLPCCPRDSGYGVGCDC